ncbi:hypothetical protein HMPREF9176_0085 [Streptococcus downei F0415]|nr:hypothetical protein HMPREF9176_0085 [Streptococcus downei F0415]
MATNLYHLLGLLKRYYRPLEPPVVKGPSQSILFIKTG